MNEFKIYSLAIPVISFMNHCKKIIVIIIMLLATNIAIGQKNQNGKDTIFTLSSVPIYDSVGNVFGYKQEYDHIPTHEDTVKFGHPIRPFLSESDSLKQINEFLEFVKNERQNDILRQDSVRQVNTKLADEIQKAGSQKYRIRAGSHYFTLHWISWENPGSVLISHIGNNSYTIKGGQRSKDNKDYIKINGTLKVVSKKELLFEGKIVSLVSGNKCERDGKHIFKATESRKYWRLRDMLNCDGELTDYIDIYF